jgi:hypothetical protein
VHKEEWRTEETTPRILRWSDLWIARDIHHGEDKFLWRKSSKTSPSTGRHFSTHIPPTAKKFLSRACHVCSVRKEIK